MAKFILPPVEPVYRVSINQGQCDWCGLKARCVQSTFPIVEGHPDLTTEVKLLKESAFSKSKSHVVVTGKDWHEDPIHAEICEKCLNDLAKLMKGAK